MRCRPVRAFIFFAPAASLAVYPSFGWFATLPQIGRSDTYQGERIDVGGADARSSFGWSLSVDTPLARNTILPDGELRGLVIESSGTMRPWDYDSEIPFPNGVRDAMQIDAAGNLIRSYSSWPNAEQVAQDVIARVMANWCESRRF